MKLSHFMIYTLVIVFFSSLAGFFLAKAWDEYHRGEQIRRDREEIQKEMKNIKTVEDALRWMRSKEMKLNLP